MIRLMLEAVKWGTDPVESHAPDGTVATGRQINVLDEQSGILVHLPFSGDSLKNLVGELAQGLTDEQRRELAPAFTGGVVLPKFPSNPRFKANGA